MLVLYCFFRVLYLLISLKLVDNSRIPNYLKKRSISAFGLELNIIQINIFRREKIFKLLKQVKVKSLNNKIENRGDKNENKRKRGVFWVFEWFSFEFFPTTNKSLKERKSGNIFLSDADPREAWPFVSTNSRVTRITRNLSLLTYAVLYAT